MKSWFINRLKSEESLLTLDGQRVKAPASKSVPKPKAFTRRTKKPNLLPEVELTLGSCKIVYQLNKTGGLFSAGNQDFRFWP